MQKTKSKLLTALLLSVIVLAMLPLAAHASTGYIRVNPTSIALPLAPSPVGQTVQAGSNVSLYFGGVTFSGGQFNLFIGPTGFSQISTGAQADVQYTPTFDLATLQAAAVTQVPGNAQFPGAWTIGFGWVNGTIKQDLPGGPFFIKAFDGTSTSVAVTDTSITITGNIFISPTSGNAGQAITINGYAFLANSLVNVTYSSVSLGPNNVVASLLQAGAIGNFSITIPAPDAKIATLPGLQVPPTEVITFAAIQNSTGAIYTATYTEYARGLVQARVTGPGGAQETIPAGQILGNNTVLGLTGVGVSKTLRFAGNNSYPGNLTTKFDNVIVANTAPEINGTGWFNTTLTIPPTTNGLHNITFTDGNNVVFVVYVTVVPSLVLTPTSGPVGTTVTATGYGFSAPTAGNVNLASLQWNALPANLAAAYVDATGTFTTTFVVPNTLGGVNTVTAYQNITGANVSTAIATFTVTASFVVVPGTFTNNASLLANATGTGFKPGSIYLPNIDNQMLGLAPLPAPLGGIYQTGVMADANGVISILFVQAGFQAGTHVFSLYENGTTTPAAYAAFTVTGESTNSSTTDLLNYINQTTIATYNNLTAIGTNVTSLKTDIGLVRTTLQALNATIIAINGNVATLQTSIGQITTSISGLSGISGTLSTISSSISGLTGTVNSINSGMATINTNLGTITTKLDTIDPVLGAVAGDTTTIKTSLGTITTSLSSIGTTVTSIQGNIATIQTDIGTIKGTVTDNKNGIATIQTSLGTMQANVGNLQTDVSTIKSDVSGTKTTTETLSPLVIVAIVLALIAAIAAIASIVMMRRKIAG